MAMGIEGTAFTLARDAGETLLTRRRRPLRGRRLLDAWGVRRSGNRFPARKRPFFGGAPR